MSSNGRIFIYQLIFLFIQECGETGRSFTFAKLRDSCAAFATRLQNQLNMKRNDVFAVCLPNVPEFPIAMFGGLEAGLTITTVNPIYTAGKIHIII